MPERACRHCHFITEEDTCPNCGSRDFTDDYEGLVILIHAENSRIAEELGAKIPGRYAVRVR